jgi:hypothetical protein
LNIPKTVVLWILKEDLGKRMLCVCTGPHSLTSEQREDQVTSCQHIIAMADADKTLFKKKTIMGVETWCFVYDPETQLEFWMGWWDIPSAEETEIPEAPHQDHVGNFFSTLKV